jgi:hypothetical protein
MSVGFEDPLLDEFSRRRGLFGGVPEPVQRLDFNFGDAGMGGAFSNPLMVMALQGLMNSAYGSAGMMPAQFMPTQSFYDQYQDKAYWIAHRNALATASQADRETYVQMLRGVSQMMGTPWGLEQQRSANVMAGDVAFMAPILAEMMPETFDAMHGIRGSATVMASFLHRGGRYAVDPVTGRTGLDADTVGSLAREMHARFFAPGTDLSSWRGMSAGQAGMLYDELQTRGLMGTSLGALTPAEQTDLLSGTPEGRRDALRLIREQDPARFERMRDQVERGQPGAYRDARRLPPGEQALEVLRDQGLGDRLIDLVRQADPGAADQLARTPVGQRQSLLADNEPLMRQVLQVLTDPERAEGVRQLASERADQQARNQGIRALPADQQAQQLATTDATARRALEVLARIDPAGFDRMVADRDVTLPEGQRLAGRTVRDQVEALTEDVGAARRAVEEVRTRDPAAFDALRGTYDRERPGGALAGLGADEQVRRLAESEGVAERAIRDMQQADPARFNALLQRFNSTQVANRLRNMAGAVSAMRDIFGDLGRPNAPMSELMEGLNSLTQGGLATMGPAELERTVRMTQVMAENSGMGLRAMTGLMAQGAAVADQLGLDRTFAVTATQQAGAFGAAYGQVGRSDLAAWGRGSRDELTIMDQQLRLRAAASEMSNRLGAAMRYARTQEQAGLPVQGPLQNVVESIRAHQQTFTNEQGEQESLNMTEGRWREIMAGSGVDEPTALLFLRSRAANQEMIHRFDIQSITRAAQPEEARAMVAEGFQEGAQGILHEAGLDDARAAELGGDVATAQAARLMGMDPAERVDARRRNEAIAQAGRQALIDRLVAEGANPQQAAAEADRLLPRARAIAQAEAGWGRLENRIAEDPAYQGYRTANRFLDVQNPRVQARAEVIRQEAEAEVQVRSALAGLGRAGPVQRLMDMIQQPPDTFGRAITQVLGVVDPEEVRRRIAGIDPREAERLAGIGARDRLGVVAEEVMRTGNRFRAIQTDRTLTPEQRTIEMRVLQQRLDALRVGGGAATAEIRRELETAGAIRPDDDMAAMDLALRQLGGPDWQQRIPGLTPEARDRILALRAVGGGIDDRALQDQQAAILREINLRPEDLDAVLAGEHADLVDPGRLDRLRQLQAARGGFDTLAADAGLVVGAQVGTRELEDVESQRSLLAHDLSLDLPADDPSRRHAVAERERHAQGVLERGRRWTSVLLQDTASVRNLGAGGFALARKAREAQLEQQVVAREAGLDLTHILAGTVEPTTDEQKQAVEQVRRLQEEVDQSRQEMIRRLNLPLDRRQAMTAAEEKELQAYQQEQATPDTERNRRLIESTLGDMGGLAGASDEDRRQLAEQLGEGEEAEANRRQLAQMAEARRQLGEIAGTKHTDLRQLREAAQAGPASHERMARQVGQGLLSTEEAERVNQLLGRAGQLAEGDTVDSVREAIHAMETRREAQTSAAEGGKAALPDKLALSGQVRLIGLDQLDFGGSSAAPGQTPVG